MTRNRESGPMGNPVIQALLIEDDAPFAELLQIWLEDEMAKGRGFSLGASIRLHPVGTMAEARQVMEHGSYQVILADLNLPDSKGLATCEPWLKQPCQTPVIVLSNLDDESLAMQAVRLGAQDYLVKSLLDGHLLLRAIRYAIERHRLQAELDQNREEQRRKREQETMERLGGRAETAVSAQALGVRSLDSSAPETFTRLAGMLTLLLEQSLEMRTHKVIHHVSKNLKELARELGFLKCGPRDVVALYREARLRLEQPGNTARNEVIHEEGRYLAFELMGHLVSCYRPYALGNTQRESSPPFLQPDGHPHPGTPIP
ncbi:MAG: response regulator [Magnetococcales bacterium]|nr:response regulator [Magnetococcales bacterium]